ncbi:uncharacterized [Tachysurus ichikawai]
MKAQEIWRPAADFCRESYSKPSSSSSKSSDSDKCSDFKPLTLTELLLLVLASSSGNSKKVVQTSLSVNQSLISTSSRPEQASPSPPK